MSDLNMTAQTPAVVTPAVQAPASKPANGAAPKKAAPKKVPAKTPEPAAPAKRSSRIEPVQAAMLEMLKTGPKSVAAMAVSIAASLSKGKAKVAVSERDVRLAIDRARAGKIGIDRTSKGVFALSKPAPKAKVSAPSK